MTYRKRSQAENDAIESLMRQNSEAPTWMLARMLHEAFPKRFASVDLARSAVKYRRGKCGAAHRKNAHASFGQHFQADAVAAMAAGATLPNTATGAHPALPPSLSAPHTPFQMTSRRTLILSDIHLPYHSVEALELALDYGERHKVDGIVLLGDIMDCHMLSRHEKDPEARSFREELESARQFIAHLRSRFPDAQIVYREGNHEARQQKYLMANAPALVGCDEFRLDVLLKLFDHRVKYVSGKRKIKVGQHLTLLHGDEFFGNFGGVNPARSMYLRAKTCVVSGHNHRTSEHTERGLDDRVVTCWSIGCLCDMAPMYMPYNNWNLGFGYVELDGDDFRMDNKRIISVNGELAIY